MDRWCGSLTSGEGVLAEGGFGGRGHISYPRAEHPLSHQGLLISGLYPTLRLLVPRMPGAPYPDKRLYPRGATGASHHRGGSISQGSEHRLEGHPFVAAYIESRVQSLPRFCAHGLFRGHLDPNGRPGHPEHPIIGPPRSQGRVRAASTIQGPPFCTCTAHILAMMLGSWRRSIGTWDLVASLMSAASRSS